MSSLFRARRGDEPRSGGKMPRSRWREPPASPYRRPENSSPPPTLAPENPSWLSGIVSGAGKLISIFRFDSSDSSSSCSSDSGSGEDICESSDEEGNLAAALEEFDELDQTGKKSESCKNLWDATQPTTEKSERKLAIEKLLMQETFSRDECNRLTKIIQSRVVDHPTMEGGKTGECRELPHRTISSAMAFSLNQERRLHGTLSNSSRRLSDLSLGSSILRAYTPELRNTAIMEARKWYEEKKLASALNTELDCGPCTLNTDMLHCDVEDEVGSLIDMAKSYMALAPWQSPILSIGFKTPPPTGMHLFKDNTPHAIGGHFLPSSKGLKRNCLATGLDETRRVRLKSAENTSEPPISNQIDSLPGMLEYEFHQTLPTADQRDLGMLDTNHDSSSLPATEATKSVGASSEFPPMLSVKDGCLDEILNSRDERTFEVNHLTNYELNNETGILNASDNDSEPEKTVHEANIRQENLAQNTLPSEAKIGTESVGSGPESPDITTIHKNQDFEEGPLIKRKGSSVSVPHEPHILDPSTVDHNDARNFVEELLDPESEVTASMDRSPFPSNAEEAVDFTNIYAPAIQRDSGSTKTLHDHKSSQDLLLPESDVRDPTVDSRRQDENDQTMKEADRSVSGFCADVVSSFRSSSSADPSISSSNRGEHISAHSSSCELTAGMTVGTCNLSSDASIDISASHEVDSIASKVQNGTSMRSIKQMLAENPPKSTRGGRARKAVAKPRRGRGRGK